MTTNKVALVTGANRGLGFEIAKQLGKQGITVVVGARTQAKADDAAARLKAEGVDAYPLQLDVTSQADIQQLPGFFERQFGRLDVLINNAGISDKDGDGSVGQLREMFETNVLGPYAIAQALLPLLKASPAGRIVNQSSMLGSLTLMSKGQGGAFMKPGYTSSKAALNMLTVVLAHDLKDTTVKVNAAHPGWVKTDMGGPGAPLEVADGAKTAVTLATLDASGPTGGFFHAGKPLPW